MQIRGSGIDNQQFSNANIQQLQRKQLLYQQEQKRRLLMRQEQQHLLISSSAAANANEISNNVSNNCDAK